MLPPSPNFCSVMRCAAVVRPTLSLCIPSHGPPAMPRSGDGEPVIRFRNYEPTSEDLASLPKVEAPVIPEVEELVGTVRSRSRKSRSSAIASPVGLLARLLQALTGARLELAPRQYYVRPTKSAPHRRRRRSCTTTRHKSRCSILRRRKRAAAPSQNVAARWLSLRRRTTLRPAALRDFRLSFTPTAADSTGAQPPQHRSSPGPHPCAPHAGTGT